MKSQCVFLTLTLISLLSFKNSQGNIAADTVTLSALFDEMISVDAESLYPQPFFFARQLTSFDRRSKLPGTKDWHANDDFSGYIRLDTVHGRVEKVLFDEKGPGVITRIITTGKAAGANLRIYFDGEKEASILIPSYDISKFPIAIPEGMIYKHEHYATTQGCSFYYPIPYGKQCKITVDNPERVFVYHVNYRSYNPGTLVKTFSLEEARRLDKKATATGLALQHPKDFTESPQQISRNLASGQSLKLNLTSGSRAVRKILFNISGYSPVDYGQLMRGLIVKITFDGKQTVRAPLSDFSGAGMGSPAVDSWFLTADGKGQVIIRFVMPYQKNAEIELTNITAIHAHADIQTNTSAWKWRENSLYFHTTWRQERGLVTNAGIDYNMGTLTGRGLFKGDALTLYNYSKRWYGEGDEHIWVDNEKFPSHFGCGTEDYYNTTYAPIHVYHNPFGGAPREDDEASRGYNSFVRTRNLDIIPFEKNLKFEFELISWDGGLVDYASTIFWYGDLSSSAINPSPDSDALSILPPAIYTDSTKTNL